MSIIKKCDRCGGEQNAGILNDGLVDIYFPKNSLQQSLGLNESFHMCINCLDLFRHFMIKKS